MTQRPQGVHYRVYLLAYDVDKGDLYDRKRTAFLTRAGVLAELALRGDVVEAAGDVTVVSTEPTGDAVLDQARQQITEHGRSWKSWLRHDYKQTLETTEKQLQAATVLTVEDKKVLGLVPRIHVTVTDAALVRQLQQEVTDILHGTTPAAEVDPADAAVVALAGAAQVPTVVTRKDSRQYKDRIDALSERLADVSPDLAKAFRGIRMTMIAAQGGMGGS